MKDNLIITLEDMGIIVNKLPKFEDSGCLFCSIFIPNKSQVNNPMAALPTYDIIPGEYQQLTFMKDYGLFTWVLIDNNIIKTTKI